MMKISWLKSTVALSATALLALTACSSPATDGGDDAAAESTDALKIALITHAGPGDTFWDIVRRGAEEAAEKSNVELLYTSDPEGGRQAQLVEQAIDQGVDGIAVTLAKPEAMKDAVEKAVAAGIPVVTLNAGGSVSAEYGAFTHFGSDEAVAGEAVGARLAAEGFTHPLCVSHEQGNVALEARCGGIMSEVPGMETLFVTGTDMTQVASTVTAKLQSSSDIDVVVGLGAPFTLTIVKAVEELGLTDTVKVASFDLNEELNQAVIDGTVLFTVDQQPWLQGYGAIDALWQRSRGGFSIGGGQPVLTGPAIIDQSNAADVLMFAAQGIR